ncbi:MAG: hypothetical protein AB7V25_15015 [Mangrovibacterium sp.]
MSDTFKDMISKNRDAFDLEPEEGHFERFRSRLDKAGTRKSVNARKLYLEIAAGVVIALLAGNLIAVLTNKPEEKPHQPLTLSSVSPEYSEVEYYYTSAIGQAVNQWEQLLKQGVIPPGEQQMIESEMKEFDETYARLQQELEASPNDERVINAMLEVYQSKLSLIHLIIDKLETIKQQKKTSHERKI